MFVALNQKVRARHATAYQNNLANFDRTQFILVAKTIDMELDKTIIGVLHSGYIKSIVPQISMS
jgi:hypothetical protein